MHDVATQSQPARPTVGRARELSELDEPLERAAAGAGSVVMLTGEPGIGKTRLAATVAGRCGDRGARSVWAACWDGGGAPAYWPWIQVLRRLLGDAGGPDLAPLAPHAAHVARLVPELADRLPLSAQWGVRPPTPLGWPFARWAALVRRECDDPVRALANYMYGAGGDVLWCHANLDAETHDWTSREFGCAPMRFLAQMARGVRAGHLVPVDGFEELPPSYVDAPLSGETPWTFVAGDRNRLFTAESQRRTHARFDERQPGRHRLEILDGYGHLDLFYARDAQARAFPVLLAALER